jgi:hypothetical protein
VVVRVLRTLARGFAEVTLVVLGLGVAVYASCVFLVNAASTTSIVAMVRGRLRRTAA